MLTEITAYVNSDIPLDAKKFTPQANQSTLMTATDQTPSVNTADSSGITVKSTPDGAEITVDGKFVGSTPSNLNLKAGAHKISIKKTGYVLWERTITLNAGGNINLDATLEKTP